MFFSTVAAADGSSQRLLFHGPDSLQQLNGVVAGQGIAGTTARELDGKDGRVVWKVYRDEKDELGMRHVFYRQHLLLAGALAEALGEPLASDGIPVLGGEVGVHTLADGTPRAVFGRQYRDVAIGEPPSVVTPSKAFELASRAAPQIEGVELLDWASSNHDDVEAARSAVELGIRSVPGAGLRLVWAVPAKDRRDLPYRILLDGRGEILGVHPQFAASVCSPSSSTGVAAAGTPQNSQIPLSHRPRAVWATAAGDRPAPMTHEAYLPAQSGLPSIEVFMGIDPWGPPQPDWQCGTAYYGLLPAPSPGGTPTLDDFLGVIPGRSGADAMWHTFLTMNTLKNTFNRCGFDGQCGNVGIVVGYYIGDADTAYFVRQDTGGMPYNQHVRVVRPTFRPFEASASLDVLAHEWGHGVVFGVGIDRSNLVKWQMHEGFANVLGHAVEWLNHSAGNGFEQADWCFGEDHLTSYWPSGASCPAFWSRADLFIEEVEQPGGQGSLTWAYHRQHNPPGHDSDGHVRGHMLAVVQYLLSAGGTNPICGSHWLADCAVAVSGMGVEKASRILMWLLLYYATPNLQWEDLPILGKFSAFDLYERCWVGRCGYAALAEQSSTRAAFSAIGYYDSSPYLECGRCP